jgi:hypothetical protein
MRGRVWRELSALPRVNPEDDPPPRVTTLNGALTRLLFIFRLLLMMTGKQN